MKFRVDPNVPLELAFNEMNCLACMGGGSRLDCAVCGALNAAEIDPADGSQLICFAENKTWQVRPGAAR